MKFELREMDFATIIDRGLKLFKLNFVPLVIIMAIFFGPFLFFVNYSQYSLQRAMGNSGVIDNLMKAFEDPENADTEAIFGDLFQDENAMTTMGIMYGVALLLAILLPLLTFFLHTIAV